MKITPQSNYTSSTGKIFYNRVIYDAELSGSNYVITEDDVEYTVPVSDEWVVMPDDAVLDNRTPLQKMYDDLKQRDTDYIKVYKDRMGIHVFRSYEEEDYYRHKKNTETSDVGLPEDHSFAG